MPFESAVCEISCSVGIALSREFPLLDEAGLMAVADAALYASKRAGRAQFQFASDLKDLDCTNLPTSKQASDPDATLAKDQGHSGPLI